jgi:hypothetical protein
LPLRGVDRPEPELGLDGVALLGVVALSEAETLLGKKTRDSGTSGVTQLLGGGVGMGMADMGVRCCWAMNVCGWC